MNGSRERRAATESTGSVLFALGLVAGLLLIPAEAQAQSPRTFGAGWAAGASYVTEVNPDAAIGATEVSPGAGFVVGMYVDRWMGGTQRVGVRVQGAYEQPRFDWVDGRRKIDTGSADVSLMLRPLSPMDGDVLPYLAGGLGAVWYDLGSGSPVSFPQAGVLHDGRSRLLPTGVLALGVDVPFPLEWHRLPVSLRFEAADHITIRSPLKRVSDGDRLGAVHHFRFTVGLYSTLRRR